MKRTAITALVLATVAGCDAYPPPSKEPAAYVYLPATTAGQGWSVVRALDTELSAQDRGRVSGASMIVGTRPEMVIDIRGTCAGSVALVANIRRVAASRGVTGVACKATLPGL